MHCGRRAPQGWEVCHVHANALPHNADPVCMLGLSASNSGWVLWHNSDEFLRMRVRRAWRLSQLRDGSSCWMKVCGPVRAVMCVLLDAGWFPLHPTNWKQSGGEGVFWSFTDAGDSAELIQCCPVTSCQFTGPVRPPTGMGRVWRK